MRFGLFGKPETRKGGDVKAEARALAERLKAQARELLGLPENAAIDVYKRQVSSSSPSCAAIRPTVR